MATLKSYAIVATVEGIYNGITANAGEVFNIIVWDGSSDWSPPAGSSAVAIPDNTAVTLGATYANGIFTAPASTEPTLTAAQALALQAEELIASGLTITSTGTPALNGVYNADAAAQQNIQATQIYIQANSRFPGSAGTMAWVDKNGGLHVFPSVAEFTAFATAVADFVADCTLIALTGAGTLPTATATIP